MTKRQASSRRRGKGSITSYRTKAGVRWRFQLWVPADPDFPEGENVHVGKGGFETAEAADDAMQEARGKQRAGVDLSAAMLTVADYARLWLDGLDLEASTVAGYRRIFKLHITPAIGAIRLDKVSARRLAKLYADLQRPDLARKRASGGLSKNSVHKVHVCLSAMLESARSEDHLIATNPARKRKTVKAPTARSIKGEKAEMTTWTGAQLRAFLTWNRDVLEDDVHALWWLIAHTGLRRSEALALRWSDIDVDGQRVKVRRALDTGLPAARRSETKGTKTGHARVVDIDAETVKVLKAWRLQRASLSLDFSRADAVVFGTLDGSPRNPMSVSQMFSRRVAKARKALGSEALPELTVHGLRHTHATVLLEAGEHPKVVQERLGHTTITTTMDVYSNARELHQTGASSQVAC